MEAPDKIWINPSTDLPKLNGIIDRDSVEYVRKDAFIEKACEFIKDNGSHYIDIVNGQLVLKKCIINDFKNHMKGKLWNSTYQKPL